MSTIFLSRSLLAPPLLLLLLFLPVCCSASSASPCSTAVHFHNEIRVFANCVSLPTQQASLAWTLTRDKSATSIAELEVLFTGNLLSPSGWAGWGINPNALAMEGTQAFLAFSVRNGCIVLPFNVSRGAKVSGIRTGPVSLDVLSMSAEMVQTFVSIVLTLRIDIEQVKSTNVVWNRGISVTNFRPDNHGFSSEDLASMSTIDFMSTPSTPHYEVKVAHSILSILGWGLILPMAIVADPRDLASQGSLFSKSHFHTVLHIAGFIVGAAGWAIGIYAGSLSGDVAHGAHRCVGIVIFTVASLNLLVFGAFLRWEQPDVYDHTNRPLRAYMWAMFYYALGAMTIVLAEVNMYLGNAILPLAASPTHRIAFFAVQCVTLLLKLVISFYHRRAQEAATDPENPHRNLLPPQ